MRLGFPKQQNRVMLSLTVRH